MEEKFKKAIAARLAMDYQELFSGDLSLGRIIAKSPVCINSINVLEAFVGSMGAGIAALHKADRATGYCQNHER